MPELLATHTTPEELLRLKSEYLIPCVYHFYRRPPHIVAGEGCRLFDHEGRRYLDCYSGVTVMSAGHSNPAIIEPAIEQLRRLQHTTSIYLTEPVLRLAEALAEVTPGALRRSFFCASGSEAAEGALLLAALHTRRPAVVAMNDGLHGRTRMAMNVTGLPLWRTDPFPLADVIHLPFDDLAALEHTLGEQGERIAAVIAEPIQGNGGIRVPGEAYWPGVRELCTRHGVLLILDEVQSGFGRTGRWFACEHWGITPDVMVLSKSLGNGLPIAAFVTTDEVAASYTRPGASTYGGNPVAAVAALATIKFHREHDLAGAARQRGMQLREGLERLAARHACLQQVRGRGLMLAADVVDPGGRPAPILLDDLLEQLKDCGFLCGKTGRERNALTFLPPLVIESSDIDLLLAALNECLISLEHGQ